jgi:hypothetical protein
MRCEVLDVFDGCIRESHLSKPVIPALLRDAMVIDTELVDVVVPVDSVGCLVIAIPAVMYKNAYRVRCIAAGVRC